MAFASGAIAAGSGRVPGFENSNGLEHFQEAIVQVTLVLQALAMAVRHRHPPANLLFHSDWGVPYAAGDFRAALAQAHRVPSMSRRGNCCDDATMESFGSTLKLELVYRRDFATQSQARVAIFDYIEASYNRERLHSALDFLSPAAFELMNT